MTESPELSATETQATPQPEQGTPQTQQAAPPIPLALPELACPNCGANILEHHGFYNYCSETQSLREDSYLYWINGRVYMEHDESGYETDSHECQATAFCSGCDNELPWSLFEIRALDGETLEAAEVVIKDLIAQAQEQTEENQPEAGKQQDANALPPQPATEKPEEAVQ